MPKILSIDVGIINLAYCIIEKENDSFHILNWDIINILSDKIQKCTNIIKNTPCKKAASTCIINNSNIKIGFCNKIKCQLAMKTTYTNNKVIKIKKITAKNTSILELCSILIKKLHKIGTILFDVDEVIIENQPVHKNPKMKSIQIAIFTFFIDHGYNQIDSRIKNIKLFSARNKLKLYNGPTIDCNIKNAYNKRKFLSIEYTKYYIKDNSQLLDFFNSNKKKDDLADCFIQGYYYLFK